MAIGLTQEELVTTFLTALKERETKFAGDMQAISNGENPEYAKVMADVQKQLSDITSVPSDITPELFAVILSIAFAILDTIYVNNAKISQYVSPSP